MIGSHVDRQGVSRSPFCSHGYFLVFMSLPPATYTPIATPVARQAPTSPSLNKARMYMNPSVNN